VVWSEKERKKEKKDWRKKKETSLERFLVFRVASLCVPSLFLRPLLTQLRWLICPWLTVGSLLCLTRLVFWVFFLHFFSFRPHSFYLSSFPLFPDSFVNLTELDVSWNKLTAFPDWVKRIKGDHVNHNNFTSLPAWFWSQEFGEILDVSGNPLDSGSIFTIAEKIKENKDLKTIK